MVETKNQDLRLTDVSGIYAGKSVYVTSVRQIAHPVATRAKATPGLPLAPQQVAGQGISLSP